jgi:hypothetical protein
MATVTTPSGEKLEGVTGSLLDYYRGEANTVPGYTIEDDEQAVTFPRVFDGVQYLEPQADATSPAPDFGSEALTALNEALGSGEQNVGYAVPPNSDGTFGPATLDTTTDPATATAEVDGKHTDLSLDDPSI